MNIIYYLIPLGIVLLVFAIGAFFWAVRSGQFEDTATTAMRILGEDDMPSGSGAASGESKEQA